LNLPTRGLGFPVTFQTGSDGLWVRARTHDAAVEYHLPGSHDQDEIVAPFGLLNDCKGTKHDEVQLETTGGGEVIAAWTDSIPQVVQHDPPSHHESVKFPGVPEEMKQDLGPTEIRPPQFVTHAQAYSSTDQATDDGEIWQEDVQVSRIGLPTRTKILVGLVLVVAVIALVIILSKGLRNESAESPAGQTELEQASTNLPFSPSDELLEPQDTEGSPTTTPESTPEQIATEQATPPGGETDLSARLARLDADTLVVPTAPPGDAGTMVAGQDLSEMPSARVGDNRTVFAGNRRFSLVLRLVCAQPVGARVKWVGQDQPLVARWPRRPTPLPSDEIEAGRGYLVREGWAVYWGASDHFYLMLDSISGVQVTLNGEPRSFNESAINRWQLVDLNSDTQP